MTEEHGRYLTQAEGDHLYQLALQSCHCWNAAACEANHQAKLRWLILPKLHILCHLGIDSRNLLYNSRFYHCFAQEDFMGFVKQVVCSTSTGPRMEERTLKRTLLKVLSSNPAEVSTLRWKMRTLHDAYMISDSFFDMLSNMVLRWNLGSTKLRCRGLVTYGKGHQEG